MTPCQIEETKPCQIEGSDCIAHIHFRQLPWRQSLGASHQPQRLVGKESEREGSTCEGQRQPAASGAAVRPGQPRRPQQQQQQPRGKLIEPVLEHPGCLAASLPRPGLARTAYTVRQETGAGGLNANAF